MIFDSSNLGIASPEIFMFVMVCVGLVTSVFVPKRLGSVIYWMVQFTLVVTLFLLYQQFSANTVFTFDQLFVLDPFAVLLKLSICVLTVAVFWYSKSYLGPRKIAENEYYLLGLISVLGMMLLVSGANLISLYLGLELFSLSLYAMVALQRDAVICTEAAMKYFIVGALASGILLYGLSMIYGQTGSLQLTEIAKLSLFSTQRNGLLYVFGLVFVVMAIAFKIGLAPFHNWVPDVYQGAPSSVTLFLSTAPKVAAFALFIRLLVQMLPGLTDQWQQLLIILAVLSIVIGNLVAIIQTNLKRMLAYSSIAQMGYMLLGIIAVTKIGYVAATFYMLSYALTTLAAFGLIVILSRDNFEAENISDFKGLNSQNPWLAFLMLLVMFSLAGIPPLVGFMAKLGVLEALIQIHMVWLATLALVFAVIGSFYYLRVVKVMYFEEPDESVNLSCQLNQTVLVSINSLLVLLLGVFPGALFYLCHSVF